MSKMLLRIFNKSETKHFDFRIKNMDGYREAMNFLANNDIAFLLHGGEEEEVQTDIRIPDGFDEMLIIYFKGEEAKVASYFAGPTHKGRSIHPKKMAEAAIKLLQEGLNGNQDNDR